MRWWEVVLLVFVYTLALIIQAAQWLFQAGGRILRCFGKRFTRMRLLRKRYVVAAAVLFAVILITVAPAVFFIRTEELVELKPFIDFEPPTIGRIVDRNGETLIELAKEYRHIVKYEELPPIVIQAILSAEDKDFFKHDGVDRWSFARVGWKILTASAGKRRVVFPQGGSTITQQLARTYFPVLQRMVREEDGDKWLKVKRKLQEIRIALWLEYTLREHFGSQQKAKEEILSRYASFVYHGNGRYGFVSASELYCGKPLAQLTKDDADCAALIAGIVKLPSAYAPSKDNLARTTQRRNAILNLMVENKFLTASEFEKYSNRPVTLPISKEKTIAPAGVEHIFSEMRSKGMGNLIEPLFEGRIEVITSTADARIQRIANTSLEAALAEYEKRHPEARGIIQGAVVVVRNCDGAILAEIGGRQRFKGQTARYTDYNRVVHSRRQPGSAFKPFVYLAAFAEGFTLETAVLDAPVAVPMGRGRPVKWINNYDDKFKGLIPVRQALCESRNAATIRIAKEVTIKNVLATAKAAGIESKLEPYITTALGASEVNLLELTNAYRALLSGVSAKPYILQTISDSGGNSRYQAAPQTSSVPFNSRHLQLIQEGLRGVVKIQGGTAYWSMMNFPYETLGKTGTTNDQKDAWFIGGTYGTDGITVGVKIGFDEPYIGYDEDGKFGKGPGRGLGDKETGGRAALPVFREIIRQVYDRKILEPAPRLPEEIEDNINFYIENNFEVPK